MNSLLNLIMILISLILIYFLIRFILCKIKGITIDEAEEEIKDFLTTDSNYDIATDDSIYGDIDNCVHKRYENLCKIGNSTIDAPLITKILINMCLIMVYKIRTN